METVWNRAIIKFQTNEKTVLGSIKVNILLVDAYHDSDRGGAGILAGLLNLLYDIESELNIYINIGIVYRFSRDDKRFESVARHTKKTFPRVVVYGGPIKTFRRNNGFRRKAEIVFGLINSFFKLCFPLLFSDPAVRAIQDSDLIISKGGHFYQFRSRGSLKGFILSYQSFYTLLLAIRLKKKIALIAHTVGPFNNHASKVIAKFVFKRVNFLSTRENISKDILVSLGIEDAKVQILPDTAFALIPASENDISFFLKKNDLKQKEYATITARYWSFPDHDPTRASMAYEKYLSSLAEIADYLIEKRYVNKIVLVVHNDGKHDILENDRIPISEVLKRMHHKDAAVVIDEDFSPAMQSALYGEGRMMIGTRLHAVIFSLVGGAPAIAISYTHKTDGIMKMLDLEKYVLNIKSIELSDAEPIIQNMIAEEANVKEMVASKIQEFRLVLKTVLKQILFSDSSNKKMR